MVQISMDNVWQRIKSLEGQEFKTKRGLPFTYQMMDNYLLVSRTYYPLSKNNFGIALELVPFDNLSLIHKTVRGQSYVWSILHDKRIRQNDW
jgi:hypothetical protein